MNDALEAFIIVLHDLLVMSPSYFVFEMESIRCAITATTLKQFKKSRRRLIIKSSVIAGIFVSFSLAAAFLDSFMENNINEQSSLAQKGLYLFGAVL